MEWCCINLIRVSDDKRKQSMNFKELKLKNSEARISYQTNQ